jgi:hypothetical protein
MPASSDSEMEDVDDIPPEYWEDFDDEANFDRQYDYENLDY